MPSTCYSCFGLLSMFINSVKHRQILLYRPLILFWAKPVHMKVYTYSLRHVQNDCSMVPVWQFCIPNPTALQHDCSMTAAWFYKQHNSYCNTAYTAMQHDCSMKPAWQFCIPPKHAAVQHDCSMYTLWRFTCIPAWQQHDCSMAV